ncbi:MAG: TetR family transcriptional regulator [Micrococcales bacterium]|nr:TetR family transcriptional regulator [Micrococcales bacterium]MCL2668832.1 TetR family transcriptional regulator [Micrococcales bacterium]
MATKRDDDELGSATRALSAAVVALTRVVGQGVTEAGREVGDDLVAALRSASQDLSEASAKAAGQQARRRAKRADSQDKRQARAATTRAQLIAAAATVFAEKGYEGSSVGDVAAEAGYTKGAVYAHFASKEDLLLGIVEMMACQDEAVFADRPAVRDLLCPASDDPETLRRTLLAMEVYTYAVRHPDAQPHLAPLVATTWDRTAEILAATRPGPPEPTQDDRDLALALLAVQTFAQIFGPVLGDDTAQESAARTIDRLLAD